MTLTDDQPDVTNDLSLLVLERRKQLNLSRRAFAELVDVVETTVRNWESGRTKPSRNDIVRMREDRTVKNEEREVLNLLLSTAGYPILGEVKEDYSGVKGQHSMSKTTELIQKVVLPFLDEDEFNYIANGDTVYFNFSYGGIWLGVKVRDHKTPVPLLSIYFTNIVRLDSDSVSEVDALRICNYMNGLETTKGKFVMWNRDLLYILDVPIQSNSGPQAFKDGFGWAFTSVMMFHKALMQFRWAGIDFVEALKASLNSEQSEESEDELGQLRRLYSDRNITTIASYKTA